MNRVILINQSIQKTIKNKPGCFRKLVFIETDNFVVFINDDTQTDH